MRTSLARRSLQAKAAESVVREKQRRADRERGRAAEQLRVGRPGENQQRDGNRQQRHHRPAESRRSLV